MDWDAIKLNWKRLIPLAKERWPECGDDLEKAGGDRAQLNQCVAKGLGITEQEAKHQTQEWGLKQEAQDDDVKAAAPAAGVKRSTGQNTPTGGDQAPAAPKS